MLTAGDGPGDLGSETPPPTPPRVRRRGRGVRRRWSRKSGPGTSLRRVRCRWRTSHRDDVDLGRDLPEALGDARLERRRGHRAALARPNQAHRDLHALDGHELHVAPSAWSIGRISSRAASIRSRITTPPSSVRLTLIHHRRSGALPPLRERAAARPATPAMPDPAPPGGPPGPAPA